MPAPGPRGHRPQASIQSLSGNKSFLNNAYSELGKALFASETKVVGNYSLGRVIGQGSFATVRLGLNRLTSTRCAIKQISRGSPPPMLTREIHHHRKLRHPHVVQLYEIIATESHIWLASELCAGGELFDYLIEQGRLSESEARRVFGQLCLGVAYIHSQGVIHRDLKLENVLLDERCNVKIADFGFGREYEKGRLMETFCGTAGYSPPEVLAGRKYPGEECDIWALGVILFALLTGELPFEDEDEDKVKDKIQAVDYEFPLWLPDDVRDLISRILVWEPRERLSIPKIVSHAWFRKPILPNTPIDPSLPFSPEPIPEEPHAEAIPYDSTLLSAMAASATEQTSPITSPQLGDPSSRQSTVEGDVPSSLRPRSSVVSLSRPSSISSPALPVAHSRTPSRTKRRSIGSTLSERLLPVALPPIIDYSSLLEEPEAEMLSTPLEKALLENLASLGFDAGQMTHSIKTNACDCSSAVWWQLKRKAEEKADASSERGSVQLSPADTFRKAKQASELSTPLASPLNERPIPIHLEPILKDPPSVLSTSPKRMRRRASSVSEQPQSGLALTTPVPMLSRSGSKSTDILPGLPRSRSGSIEALGSMGDDLSSSPPGSGWDKKREKQRSASISTSILQRATSAFTTKESSDGSGRATPLGIIFGRKPATQNSPDKGIKDPKGKENTEAGSLGLSQPKSLGDEGDERPRPDPTAPRLTPDSESSPALGSDFSHDSQGTAETTESQSSSSVKIHGTSPSSATTSGTAEQGRSRGSLFSSFRLWFNEDRKRRKRRAPLAGFEGSSTRVTAPPRRPSTPHDADSTVKNISRHSSSAGRRQSSRRSSFNSAVHIASLDRHPSSSSMQRRLSSSSKASFASPTLGTGGDSPTSERGSRPASLFSVDTPLGDKRFAPRHARTGSTGSHNSRKSSGRGHESPGFRRPTTTTQVRRISRPGHPRRDSTSSSVHSLSSRRSSQSEDEMKPPSDHSVIQEEAEEQDEETLASERDKALRKLSGDYSRTPRVSTLFAAHKAGTVFASPAVVGTTAHSRNFSVGTVRPKIRDVFATKKLKHHADEEWVDEDELEGFAGGFGQGGTSTMNALSPAPGQADPFGSVMLGAGRYAGVGEAVIGSDMPGRAGKAVGLGFRAAAVIEEEEEEEEEEDERAL